MYEPTSAEWVIGEWVTLDRELHPFEALELATVIEAVKLHVLHGWPRCWAWPARTWRQPLSRRPCMPVPISRTRPGPG